MYLPVGALPTFLDRGACHTSLGKNSKGLVLLRVQETKFWHLHTMQYFLKLPQCHTNRDMIIIA